MERLTNSKLGDVLATPGYTAVTKQAWRSMRDSVQGSAAVEELYSRLSMIEDILGDEYTEYQLLSMKANYERIKEYTKGCDSDEVVMISAEGLSSILWDRLRSFAVDGQYGSLSGAMSGVIRLVDAAPKLTLEVPQEHD